MPYLFESNEWLLMYELGQAFDLRKSRFQSGRPEAIHRPVAEHIESGLRLLLRPKEEPRGSPQHLSDEIFNIFHVNLCRLCSVLNRLVSEELVLPHTASVAAPYRQLRSLRQFLISEDITVDLVHGPNTKLFTLPRDDGEIYEYRRLVDDANQALGSLCPTPFLEPRTPTPSRRERRDAWKKAEVRKQTTDTLEALFQRFTCNAQHEVLLRLTRDTGENDAPLSLELILPSTCREAGSWRQARCQKLHADAPSPALIRDICGDLRACQSQRKMLTLYLYNSQLLGSWEDLKVPVTQLHRESLRDLIVQGAFKNLSSDINAALRDSQAMTFSILDKRRLALELGFGLMDFFDAEVSSKRVYILSSAGQDVQPYLAFTSKLPATSNPYEFSRIRPHPMLLSFSKLLLEIHYGQVLDVEIGVNGGQQDLENWVRLGDLVERLLKKEPDSYVEAIESCLSAHRGIANALGNVENLSAEDVERRIRRKLYKEVVHKLERSVSESSFSSSSSQRRRGRSESSTDGLDGPDGSISSGSRDTSSSSFESGTGLRRRKRHPRQGLSNKPPLRPLGPEDFEIAIICALEVEYNAVSLIVDGYLDQLDNSSFGKTVGDTNMYRTCHIGKANVVLVHLPAIGKVSAAVAATSLRISFKRLKLVLVVGICGGVPHPGKGQEILLGDVVVSNTAMQYDLGSRFPDAFAAKEGPRDCLRKAPRSIDSLVSFLQLAEVRQDAEYEAADILYQLQAQIAHSPNWKYPGASKDRLLQAHFHHKHHRNLPSPEAGCLCYSSTGACENYRSLSCQETGCLDNDGHLVQRNRLNDKREKERQGYISDAQSPSIFVGPLGSADMVLKSAEHRDRYAKDHGLVAFEMEGAGVWDIVPTIVIKGVCDYADSHKNKDWQAFASLTAASVAKVILNLYTRDSDRQQGSI